MLVVPRCLLVERTSWKPSDIPSEALEECLSSVANLPFAPSLRQEKLGRCCDFTFWNLQKTAAREAAPGRGSTSAGGAGAGDAGGDDFTLVDSSRVVRQKSRFVRRPRLPPAQQHLQRQQQQTQTQKQTQTRFNQRQLFQRGGKKDKLGAAYQQPRPQRWTLRARAMAAEYHVEVDPEWSPVCDLTLQSLVTGFQAAPREITFRDTEWRGVLRNFDRSFDRVTPKTAVPLSDRYMAARYSIVVPRARNDEVLTGLLQENDQVVAIVTDQLLATLLALPQSRFSWQIYAYRIDGKLILEKPESSTLDLFTVNETAPDPPTTDNSKARGMYDVGVEAAKVNYEFAQMTLEGTKTAQTFGELPFAEDTEPPPYKAYRYRLITIPPGKTIKGGSSAPIRREPIVLAVRTEIDGVIELDDQQCFLAIHALTEATGKSQNMPYAEALERRKGDLFITELKNNACKMAKWVYCAMIAGVSHLKIGFVAKKQNKFSVLQVQTVSVQTLAAQMGLKLPNAWGIVREILDTVLANARGDGQYIITRDPIQSQIKIHFKPLEKTDFGGAVSDEELD
eukprot:Gregarina_sp_Pseudo_9__6000@NODE_994_length_1993_cov_9_315251_g932_i0_p1_GENE_NODE_994_length_1993_cov_9_315251_g932_i0NODE_994_length_1993_cov_9_315251_g932_i0_p1_ORF_typecomplete_len565_score186_27eIF3_zeta/PF05091_12/4_5e104Activator_LAG3/PF11498_8/0_74Activator_LAG3/PF11498_8/3_2e03_NODE_994_length_1993_cov_9_315251_g932_i01421836